MDGKRLTAFEDVRAAILRYRIYPFLKLRFTDSTSTKFVDPWG